MAEQHLTSREYKLILSAERFSDRRAGSAALRDIIHLLADRLGASVEDQKDEEERRTYYLDTEDFDLQERGFALRIRFEADEDEYKITLKHRSRDRYIAASKNLSSAEPRWDDPKFEEDVLPPFRSIYSQSNALWSKQKPKLKHIGDAADLFPVLSEFGVPRKTRLSRVNGFKAHEYARKLCKIRFDKGPKVKLGLSFWYSPRRGRWPLIAECAFDFDTRDKNSLCAAVGANALFQSLQNQPGWFDLDATTKTRYVYEGLS